MLINCRLKIEPGIEAVVRTVLSMSAKAQNVK